MKLAKKTFVTIVSTLGVLFVLQFFLAWFILLNGFEMLEKRDANNSVDRVRDVIQEQVEALADKVVDWSVWDDAYAYAQTGNEEFEKSNLTANTLPLLKLHMMGFLKLNGEVIFGRMADAEGHLSDLSPAVVEHLEKHQELYTFSGTTHAINGLVSMGGLPMLISSHPIVKSDGSGPIVGALIIGRYLDQKAIDQLTHLSRLSLQIAMADDQMAAPFVEAASVLKRDTDKLVKAAANDFLTGYTLFQDVYGDKCLYMAVQIPRDVKKQANVTIISFFTTMLVGGMLLVFLINWRMNHSVIHPIVKLNQTIKDIIESDNFGMRVPVQGEDEIAGLASEMNLMLGHIEQRNKAITDALDAYGDAKAEADRANRAKSQFLANMSHEIRTPLNAIIGLTEIISFSSLDEEQREMFKGIQSESNALHELICEILDISKIESGHTSVEVIPFNLGYLFKDITDVFTPQAEQKGIIFQSILAAEIPTSLLGDSGRLRQILRNLLGNALKFTPAGGRITLTGDLGRDLGSNQCHIKFAVQDTGIGIPAEQQGRVFESFQQADNSTTRKYGGTGLGLTISKQLSELMGGEIGVASVAGQGSTFWVSVPFGRQPGDEANQLTISEEIIGATALIIHSSRERRDQLASDVEALGLLAVTTGSAAEALVALNGLPVAGLPQLIFCQLHMPEVSGFDFVQRLKAERLWAAIPVILITSSGISGDAGRCRELGVWGYWTDPLNQSDVFNITTTVLSQSKDPAAITPPQPLITRHSFLGKGIGRFSILLVEDYVTNQKVATLYLQRAGFAVDLANNGKEAVEKFRGKGYSLILMDLHMPEMDGFTATRIIRQQEEASGVKRTPIIALTAAVYASDRQACHDAGMDDFLEKPLKQTHLIAKLVKWLGQGRAGCATSSWPEEGKGATLPAALPGLEIGKALDVMAFDAATYVDIAASYYRENRDVIPALRAAFAGRDWGKLEKLAHSLKGTSAIIGAYVLQGEALALEKRCLDSAVEPPVLALIDQVEIAYRQVLDSLVPLLQTNRPEPAPTEIEYLAPEALLAVLQQFSEAITTADLASIRNRLAMLQRYCNDEALSRLAEELDNYDYDDALASLREIAGRCGGTL